MLIELSGVNKLKLSYLLAKLIKKLHIPAIKESCIHKTSKICSGSHIVSTNVKKYSYIGNFCTVINSNIGSFCSIADNCIIGAANHPIDWVSTSPVFHKGKNVLKKNFAHHELKADGKTIIGSDVWIGNNCLIKGGIEIGDGAIIGMGSIVTKNVGPYEIWAGNPAKLIRKRFDDEVIKELTKIKWWDWEDEKVSMYSKFFIEPKHFTNNLKKELY